MSEIRRNLSFLPRPRWRYFDPDVFRWLVRGPLAKEGRKEFELLVARISAKGRAARVHLVVATQRPDRETVSGLLKANLPLKVCFKVTNAVNSTIVLDQPGAEKLLGRGDFLCDRGKGLERGQASLISRERFEKALAH